MPYVTGWDYGVLGLIVVEVVLEVLSSPRGSPSAAGSQAADALLLVSQLVTTLLWLGVAELARRMVRSSGQQPLRLTALHEAIPTAISMGLGASVFAYTITRIAFVLSSITDRQPDDQQAQYNAVLLLVLVLVRLTALFPSFLLLSTQLRQDSVNFHHLRFLLAMFAFEYLRTALFPLLWSDKYYQWINTLHNDSLFSALTVPLTATFWLRLTVHLGEQYSALSAAARKEAGAEEQQQGLELTTALSAAWPGNSIGQRDLLLPPLPNGHAARKHESEDDGAVRDGQNGLVAAAAVPEAQSRVALVAGVATVGALFALVELDRSSLEASCVYETGKIAVIIAALLLCLLAWRQHLAQPKPAVAGRDDSAHYSAVHAAEFCFMFCAKVASVLTISVVASVPDLNHDVVEESRPMLQQQKMYNDCPVLAIRLVEQGLTVTVAALLLVTVGQLKHIWSRRPALSGIPSNAQVRVLLPLVMSLLVLDLTDEAQHVAHAIQEIALSTAGSCGLGDGCVACCVQTGGAERGRLSGAFLVTQTVFSLSIEYFVLCAEALMIRSTRHSIAPVAEYHPPRPAVLRLPELQR